MKRRNFLIASLSMAAWPILACSSLEQRISSSLSRPEVTSIYAPRSLANRITQIAKDNNIHLNGYISGNDYYALYSDFFSLLTRLPMAQRQLLLENYYAIFPNGDAETSFIQSLIKIKWFSPTRKYTNVELQPYVNNISKKFNMGKLEAKLTNNLNEANIISIFDEAYGLIKEETRIAATLSSRNEAFEAAWQGGYAIAQTKTNRKFLKFPYEVQKTITSDASLAAAYIIVQDTPEINFKYPDNPFNSLIEIYRLGMYPGGVQSSKFIIWQPKVE